MNLTLKEPFAISPSLTPSVRIADNHETAFLCLSDVASAKFTLLLPDGSEHVIDDYQPGAGCVRNTGKGICRMFADVLGFMSACGDSYRYCLSKVSADKPIESLLADSECGTLFPPTIAEFCYRMSEELQMLQLEIEEAEEPLITIQ